VLAQRAVAEGGKGTARPSFLLAEAARSECAPSMRAVKGRGSYRREPTRSALKYTQLRWLRDRG